MQSWRASTCYLGSFIVASTLSMGTFAAIYGEVTIRIGSTAVLVELILRVFSSCLSIVVGALWLILSLLGKLEGLFHWQNIYIHIYMHTYMHMYLYTYMYLYEYICMKNEIGRAIPLTNLQGFKTRETLFFLKKYIYIHKYMHTHMHMYLCTYMYINVSLWIYVYENLYMEIWIFIHMYIYICKYICIYILKTELMYIM
jgi:hypothetical protein